MTLTRKWVRWSAVWALLLGVLTACTPDTSPLAVLPTGATGAEIRSGIPSGRVGRPIPEAVTIRIVDRIGNPVPNLEIAWSVAQGGGSANPATSRTNNRGEAATVWTLGTIAGTHTLTASPPGLEAQSITATALAGPPHSISSAGGDQQAQTVAAAAPDSLVARVVDEYGNVVRGANLAWAAVGGSVSPTTAVTNAAGEAKTRLVLGTVAGPVTVTASLTPAAPVTPATFRATANPGPPYSVVKVRGDDQTAVPQSTLPDSLVVRVADRYDNPVAGAEVVWVPEVGGTVTPATNVTSPRGEAWTRWTLGGGTGRTALTATVAGVSPIQFTATRLATHFNLSIEGFHLNQGNQTASGGIPAIAGRPGLLRVVVRANEPNTRTPPLRLRLYQGASLLREVVIPSPAAGVPVNPDLTSMHHSFNLTLRGDEVQAGMTLEAEIDPDASVPETTRADNRWPRGSGRAPLDVVTLAPLRIVFIPVYSTVTNRLGNITAGNAGSFLDATYQWIPSSAIIYAIRTPYTTNLDLRAVANWSTLVGEIQAARTVEGARDEYYHGIIGDFPGIPLAGMGYVPGTPSSPFRSSITYDRLPAAAGTVAHELGHNLGRFHSPCGDVAGPDPGYPHANARLGSTGFDILRGRLLHPLENADYMSYCHPRWTSDYTFAGILQWRRNDPLARAGEGSAPGGSVEGVLLWGEVGPGSAVLNPAFTLAAPAVLPARSGPNQLRGLAADGTEVFRISFEGEAVADGPDSEERHFAFLLPLPEGDRQRLASIELVTPSSRASRTSRQAGLPQDAGPGMIPAPAARVESVPGQLRVRWSADSFPMALLRDPATGHVLSFARGGDAWIRTDLDGRRVEVILSDGVRSFVAPVP